VIAVFDTSLGAVFAAVAIDADMTVRAEASPENRRMLLRVGVHSGDIPEQEDGSVYGDAVNIAAWLESLAPSGGVTVSKEVQKLAGARSELRFVDQGDYDVKNISRPIRGLSRGAGRRVEQSRPVRKRPGGSPRATCPRCRSTSWDAPRRSGGVARCSASRASSRCSAWAAWAKPACLSNWRAARRLTFPTAPGSPTLPR
jgi:adenylate cyclase